MASGPENGFVSVSLDISFCSVVNLEKEIFSEI